MRSFCWNTRSCFVELENHECVKVVMEKIVKLFPTYLMNPANCETFHPRNFVVYNILHNTLNASNLFCLTIVSKIKTTSHNHKLSRNFIQGIEWTQRHSRVISPTIKSTEWNQGYDDISLTTGLYENITLWIGMIRVVKVVYITVLPTTTWYFPRYIHMTTPFG